MSDSRRAQCPVGFDHNSREFLDHRYEILKEARACPALPLNTNYGGFWMALTYANVEAAQKKPETFTSRYEPEALDGIKYQGLAGIPRNPSTTRVGLGESIGERHIALRRAFMPYFTPQAMAELRPLCARLANWFLDRHIEQGSMDFVRNFASPVPSVATMKIFGLPWDDWEGYAEFFHGTSGALPAGTEEYARNIAKRPMIRARLLAHADQRRADPRDDLTTAIVKFKWEGKPLGEENVAALLFNFVGGGVGTTAGLTSLVLHHFARNPALREQLRRRRELMPGAIEEFLRYFSSVHYQSRTVTEDTELGGEHLKRGDHVYMGLMSANRDERQFERPDELLLDRSPNRHLAFGLGPHRCIGAHFARMLTDVMLNTVLDRIPDYEVDEANAREYFGVVTRGMETLPIRFAPGMKVETEKRPQ